MWSQNRLSKMRRLSWSDWGVLVEAAVLLAASRLSLLLVPFRKIAPRLGVLHGESSHDVSSANTQWAHRVGWAVRAVARRTPWESACLAQAISAKLMLQRRHIASTLYLGLAKGEAQKMEAHAWLRCGEEVITGKAGHERFSVISSFAEPEPENAETVDADKVLTLLLAALHPHPTPETAVHLQNLTEAEWHQLIEFAQEQFVATLLFARLEALGVHTAVPTPLWTQLQARHKYTTLQNMAAYRELNLIYRAMEADDIPMVVLKGGYLATAVYPHIGQRTMGDLDLLLMADDVPKMIDILHTLGWQEPRPLSLEANRAQFYHLPPFAKQGSAFVVELHWHITRPEQPYSISPDQLWQHTMPCQLAGSHLLAFQPHLQLLHLALHASYNHQFAFDLRSLCDITVLIQKCSSELQWDQVVALAKTWNWQRGVYLTLALINEFWETAVPPHILPQLKPESMPENLVNLTKEHLFWGRIENKKVSSNFSQLSDNKSILTKISFALGILFPTRNRLSWRYGVPLNSGKIWLYYLVNLGDMVRRNTGRALQLLRKNSQMAETAERRNLLANWLGESQ